MANIEALIADVRRRYGLGEKTGVLVAETTRFMTDGPKGIAGFLERFKAAGFDRLVASWLGAVDPAPLAVQQVEQGLGSRAISAIASKVGFDGGVITPALGCLIPRLVGMLTPGGTPPSALPAVWKNFLDPAAGAAATAEPEAVAAQSAEERAKRLLMAAGTLCVLVAGLWWLGRPPSAPPAPAAASAAVAEASPAGVPTAAPAAAPAPPPAPAAEAAPPPAPSPVPVAASEPTPAPPPAPAAEAAPPPAPSPAPVAASEPTPAPPPPPVAPSLRIAFNAANFVKYSGATKDEATRAAIVDALATAFGAGNVKGEIAIDPNAAPAPWLANLKTALGSFKIPGLSALFNGADVKVGGLISERDRDRVIGSLTSAFGSGFTVGALAENPNAKASEAFKALKAGFSAKDAADALNLVIINFATGSAAIPSYNLAILDEAAATLKKLPAGAAIEIQGHTDNAGDDAANLRLSQRRADAVRAVLAKAGVAPEALKAKGYGSARPKAGNDTAEGRYENRRIAFAAAD